MTLVERLTELMTPHGSETRKMFGGTCFMVRGHMALGTLKDGLIVRVGKAAHAAAMKLPGARVFDMTGRPMEGFVSVDGKAVASGAALGKWIAMALAFNRTLPEKKAKAGKK